MEFLLSFFFFLLGLIEMIRQEMDYIENENKFQVGKF